MPLDLETEKLLNEMNASGAPKLYELSVGDARAALSALAQQHAGRPERVRRCEDRSVGGPRGAVPIRIYWPVRKEDLAPVVCFMHGGGFALGDLESHDAICRRLCNMSRAIFISIDYRRPPENPFPAAPEDCFAAVKWAAEYARSLGGDPSRLAVMGDSAGGNLSAAVCLMARDRGGPAIAYQVLCYPCVHLDPRFETPSRKWLGGGEYFLSSGDMRWIAGMYLKTHEDALNPYASPILAESFKDLPATLIITSGYDMLRDEGEDYCNLLKSAGVEADLIQYAGTIHGFLSFNAILQAGSQGLDMIAERLREKLQ